MAGQPVSLEVEAGGTLPLAFQWFNGATEVPGATQRILTFAAVNPANAGSYRVRVTNPWGEAISENAAVAVLVPPVITALDLNVPVLHGGNTQLQVTATGSGTLTYQWFAGLKGTTSSPVGAGQPTLPLLNVTTPASYWVRVGNLAGAVDSETGSASPCSDIRRRSPSRRSRTMCSGTPRSRWWPRPVPACR